MLKATARAPASNVVLAYDPIELPIYTQEEVHSTVHLLSAYGAVNGSTRYIFAGHVDVPNSVTTIVTELEYFAREEILCGPLTC